MKRHLFMILITALAVFLCTGCSDPDPVTVYLVRHAEKELADPTDNPPLTEAGMLRAERLVDVIGTPAPDGIYSTGFDRTINTVKPLADRHRLVILEYEYHQWQPMLDSIRNQPGKNFVICGHGDNLLPMIHYLGGTSPLDSLGKYEYDKIFRVRIGEDSTGVEVISY